MLAHWPSSLVKKHVGIITERDYARKVFLKGRASPTTSVREIMETKVFHAQPDQSVEDCMAIMTDKRIRHLPVIEDAKRLNSSASRFVHRTKRDPASIGTSPEIV